MGLRSLCTRHVPPGRCRAGPGRPSATASRPASSSSAPSASRPRGPPPAGQSVSRAEATRSSGRRRRTGPGPRHRHAAEVAGHLAELRPDAASAGVVERREQQVAAAPPATTTSPAARAGRRRRLGPPYLQDVGHRQQPAHQPQHRGVHLGCQRRRRRPRRVDAHHRPLPRRPRRRTSVRTSRPPAGSASEKSTRRTLPQARPCDARSRRDRGATTCRSASASSAARSPRRSPGTPTGPTGTATPTSTSPPTASSSATSASCGGPRASRGRTPACSATSPASDVLEVGSGAGQCSRWVRARGGRAIGLDLSQPPAAALAADRRRDRRRRCPSVRATATALPFADDAFDVVFSLVRRAAVRRPTSTAPSPRWRGCCARAAGSPSRSPTRPGGCSPTTPARAA